MSIIPPGFSRSLQFYLSGPLPCPYLPHRVERKLFTHLDQDDAALNAEINAALCRVGFRRSHDVAYRPACSDCNACIPVRIPVAFFAPDKTLRKTAARNRDLIWSHAEITPTTELFALFSAYQTARHADSDMARMTEADFAAMLLEGKADTHLYQLRDADGGLKGCMIADHVGDGLSAVYSFFDPAMEKRSLGTQLVLSLIDEAARRNWPFVYLGYWVEQSRKMSYKSRFRPLQFLGPQGWGWLGHEKETV